MDITPEKIANIYKERWKIETFFKFIKQNLNLKRLFGASKNAVYNQIFISLMTYVFIQFTYVETTKNLKYVKLSLIQFIRKLISNKHKVKVYVYINLFLNNIKNKLIKLSEKWLINTCDFKNNNLSGGVLLKTLVIIPAYNEEKNIKKVVHNLINNYPQFDYVIVNDCSTDNTKKLLEINNYNYINLPVNLGIGGGVQTGYKYALENDYDIAIQMDGDGQHDPKFFESFIQPIIEGNADIVIGSRFIEKNGFQSTAIRRIGINFLSTLIKLVSGVKVKDVTSGYRAVNQKFIEIYAKEYAQDYPEPEAIVNAAMNNARVLEYPVIMFERFGGESSISPFKSVYYMIKVSIAIILYRVTFDKRRIK